MPAQSSERAVRDIGSVAVLSAVLVALTALTASAQTRTPLGSYRLAGVYRIDLPARTQTAVTPRTTHGLVWVAITNGTVLVGGVAKAVNQGAAEGQQGAASVSFRAADAKAAQFVVADLLAPPPVAQCEGAEWGVGIENWAAPITLGPPSPNDPTRPRLGEGTESLGPGVTIDEAVPSGVTLVGAVAPLLLRDDLNLAEEGEPRRLAEPKVMKLAAAEVQWTRPGGHLITNVGKTNARFVRIMWWCR